MNILIRVKENTLLGSVFFIICGAAVSALVSLLLTISDLAGNGENMAGLLDMKHITAVIIICVATPVFEELLFRFIIYRQILRKLVKADPCPASLMTGLIFGSLHSPVSAMVTGFAAGVILCCVYEKSGRLLYSICCHAGFNTMSYMMMLLF